MLSRTHDNVKFANTALHTARKRIGKMCIHDTTLTSSSTYYNNQIFPSTILQTWTEHVITEAFLYIKWYSFSYQPLEVL